MFGESEHEQRHDMKVKDRIRNVITNSKHNQALSNPLHHNPINNPNAPEHDPGQGSTSTRAQKQSNHKHQ